MPPFLVGTYLLLKGHRDDLSPETEDDQRAAGGPRGSGRGLAALDKVDQPIPPLPVAGPAGSRNRSPADQTRDWLERQLANTQELSDKVGAPAPLSPAPPRAFYDANGTPIDTRRHPEFGAIDRPPAGATARPTTFDQVMKSMMGVQADDARPKDKVDWDFINWNETKNGAQKTNAIVPSDKHGVIGRSGVTVAHGFDLGGRSERSLQAAGVDQALIDKLAPYLPYRGQTAKQYLDQHPLNLSLAEADALDAVARQEELGRLARAFDRSSTVGRFYDLPAKTQTAITDVFFQYGTHDPASAAPKLWRQITTGQWGDAHRNLMNFGDRYEPRQIRDAGLVLEDINAGNLRPFSPDG